jgi:release factor glutamine methyltransferase
MTIAALLSDAAALLSTSSESPRTDASLLLAHVLSRPREWLVAHSDALLSAAQKALFETLCTKRRTGVPVAYLLGTGSFYGREFLVNEDVLVPRPETEHLIDEALRLIDGPIRVLDVGTGSGAIACTIAAETQAAVDATDISPFAITVASANAQRLGVSERCTFRHGDLAQPVRGNRYDLIVANLPYIPTSDLPKPPEPASFEPRLALDGGPDGLVLYRRLLAQLRLLLSENARALLECAPPTIHELSKIVEAALGNADVAVINDYSGLPRCVSADCRRTRNRHSSRTRLVRSS